MQHLLTKRFTSLLLYAILAFLGGMANAKGGDADALLSKTVIVRNTPGSTPSEPLGRLVIGEAVKIQKRAGNWRLVQGATYGGWVPANYVISIHSFHPITEWRGPKTLETGDGDYGATYHFKSDGTFSVQETEQTTDEKYRLVTRKGRLHSYGNFVWARSSDGHLYSSRIFVRNENGKLCWQGYIDDRCGAPGRGDG